MGNWRIGCAIPCRCRESRHALRRVIVYHDTVIPIQQKEMYAEENVSLQSNNKSLKQENEKLSADRAAATAALAEESKKIEASKTEQQRLDKQLKETTAKVDSMNQSLSIVSQQAAQAREVLFVDAITRQFGKAAQKKTTADVLFPKEGKPTNISKALANSWPPRQPIEQITKILNDVENNDINLGLPMGSDKLRDLVEDLKNKVNAKRQAFICRLPDFSSWSAAYIREYDAVENGADNCAADRVETAMAERHWNSLQAVAYRKTDDFRKDISAVRSLCSSMGATGAYSYVNEKWDKLLNNCQGRLTSAVGFAEGSDLHDLL
jgi:hypothetical protein